MYQLESILNTIIHGNSLDILRQIPDARIDMAITSPPYFGKRDYSESTEAVWGGLPDCEHEWGDDLKINRHKAGETNPGKESWYKDNGAISQTGGKFCLFCDAWKGQLGLEPTPSLYIQNLVEIFTEVMRVLKPYGSLYVNLGDSYNNNPSNSAESNLGNASALGVVGRQNRLQANIPTKSLLCIPDRFKMAMVERGWVCRNELIWKKPNAMPQSSSDRFTEDFEKMFFFVKSNSDLFWTNEKTLELATKPPKGTGGIEGIDWCWIPCLNCNKPKEAIQASLEEPDEPPQQENGACKRCGGLGRIKQSYWQSHDYYFEQQFEPYTEPLNRRGGSSLKANGNSNWGNGTGQDTYRDRSMRPNPLGRNKRTVWDIPEETFAVDVHGEVIEITTSELEYILQNRTREAKGSVWDIVTKPSKESHYASYPQELIETPISASCPEFVCKKCGVPRVKIYKSEPMIIKRSDYGEKSGNRTACSGTMLELNKKEAIGYAKCNCGASFAPGIVLDMFIGSGTTAITAKELGRSFIGCELNPDYIKRAQGRIERIKGTQKTIESWGGSEG